MILYSAVSSPLDRSKRFTLSSPGRPVHSDTVLGFSSQERTRDDMQRDDNEWRVVSRRRLTQDRCTPGQCAKCGETNHVTARCKHAEHVQCRRCGKLGHKDKHHYYDQDRGQYVMATGTSDPYMYAGNNARKSKWDLPVIINLNARSLSIEKTGRIECNCWYK